MASTERLDQLFAALEVLKESLELCKTPMAEKYPHTFRDSVIKRFEFTIDLLWKNLKDFLELQEVNFPMSPKGVFRAAFDEGFINASEYQVLLDMIGARNNTSHRYEEAMAIETVKKISEYYSSIESLTERLSERMEK